MLEQQHWSQCIRAEGEEGIVVVDLRRRLLGEKNAWDAQGEAEVRVLLVEQAGHLLSRISDGLLVFENQQLA